MSRGQKITVKDSVKILEMIAKDRINWTKDEFWGYEVPLDIPGVNLERFDLKNFYNDDEMHQLTAHLSQLKKERLDWLSRFPRLHTDMVKSLNP